jgi:hypothetical protein
MNGAGVHCRSSKKGRPDSKNRGIPYALRADSLAFLMADSYDTQWRNEVRDSPSYQRSIEHCSYIIDLHLWQKGDHATFATFVYEKASERLLRHFANTDETEVIRKALVWCERHSVDSRFFTSVSAS